MAKVRDAKVTASEQAYPRVPPSRNLRRYAVLKLPRHARNSWHTGRSTCGKARKNKQTKN